MAQEKLLTRKEVAELLNTTLRSVDRFVNRGYFSKVRVGSKVYIPGSELCAYLNAQDTTRHFKFDSRGNLISMKKDQGGTPSPTD